MGQNDKAKAEADAMRTNLAAVLAVDPESSQVQSYIQKYPSLKNDIIQMQNDARYAKTNAMTLQNLIKTPEGISEAVSSGMIVPGTEAWNTLAAGNPDLINQWAVFEKRKIVTDLINGKYEVNPFDPTKVSGQILSQVMNQVMGQDNLSVYDSMMANANIQGITDQI